MSSQELFRFMYLRPARKRQVSKDGQELVDTASTLYHDLAEAANDKERHKQMLRLANEFRDKPDHVEHVDEVTFPVGSLMNWWAAHRNTSGEVDLEAWCRDTCDGDLKEVIAGDAFQTSYRRLSDTLMADFITGDRATNDSLVRPLKLMQLMVRAAEGTVDLTGHSLAWLIDGSPSFLPEFLAPPQPTTRETPVTPPVARPEERDQLRRQKKELVQVREEMDYLLGDRSFFKEEAQPEPGPTAGPRPSRLFLNERGLARMSKNARTLLKRFDFNPENQGLIEFCQKLDNERAHLEKKLGPKTRKRVKQHGVTINLYDDGIQEADASIDIGEVIHQLLTAGNYKVGVADLLLIEQQLKAYELGEFAHVENALAGEKRERIHERRSQREQVGGYERETSTEEERDLQSTERNELQKEARQLLTRQFELDTGLEITLTFGPAVIGTHFGINYQTNEEQEERTAVSFSKEVTEKSVERVKQNVKEHARTRVSEEIFEKNLHSVDNQGRGEHMRGIYRWLDKVYQTRMLNYGKRLMLDFIIPEPALGYLHALQQNPPVDGPLTRPELPLNEDGEPLTPKDLNLFNYEAWYSLFQVFDGPAYPEEVIHISEAFSGPGTTGGDNEPQEFSGGRTIEIEPNYEVNKAFVQGLALFEPLDDDTSQMKVLLGGETYTLNGSSNPPFSSSIRISSVQQAYQVVGHHSSYLALADGGVRINQMALGYGVSRCRHFSISVDLEAELTERGIREWRNKAFAAIMQGYQIQLEAFLEQEATAAMRSGPELGLNPSSSAQLIGNELKKLAIMLLRGTNHPGFDCYHHREGELELDFTAMREAAPLISFMEKAFDWKNMTYTLLAYFWGAQARWANAISREEGADAVFCNFLRAGAVDLRLPVMPGYEASVASYCQTGRVPRDDTPVVARDDVFHPALEELTDQADTTGEPQPWPDGAEPWDVRVPTSLVLVQDPDEIAGIRDSMTGAPIDIGSLPEPVVEPEEPEEPEEPVDPEETP